MYVKYFCSLNQTYKKAAGNWTEKNEHITSLKIYCTVYYADFSKDKFKKIKVVEPEKTDLNFCFYKLSESVNQTYYSGNLSLECSSH